MQHKPWQMSEIEPLRRIGIAAGVAICLAMGSAFAVTSSEVPPLVIENRFAIAGAADANLESPVAQSPVAKRPDSIIETLLAPATSDAEREVASFEEAQPVEVPPPVAEVATTAEPELTMPVEPEAKTQAEPVAEAAEFESTPWEAVPPPEVEVPETQSLEVVTPLAEPPSEPWQSEVAPSSAWQPEPDVRPLPAEPAAEMPEPPADMLDELDAPWSDEFQSEPERSDSGAAAMPYSPTVAELSAQLLPSVRKAYGLAQHGAVYAAQTEFIQVLRRIAQSKDAAEGVDEHSRALAVGLRALDEADDFVPQGTQLEGELNVEVVASAHRTPVLGSRHANARPDEAIALYHQYAREQLARAVAGERAGSMALYGLGKVQNRLAYESDGELRHERKALVMFQAALEASPANHLAANEIGVLFARGGQPVEASAMFRRAIDITPTTTSYHNLAVAERSLGQVEQAAANERFAQYLAAQDRAAGNMARRSGVEWVSPQDLSRVAQPMPIPAGNQRVAGDPRQASPPPARLPEASSPMQTAAKWPQKLVPGIFRR